MSVTQFTITTTIDEFGCKNIAKKNESVCLGCYEEVGTLSRVGKVPCFRIAHRLMLLVIGIELWKFLKYISAKDRVAHIAVGVIHGLLLFFCIMNLFSFRYRRGAKVFAVLSLCEFTLFLSHKLLHYNHHKGADAKRCHSPYYFWCYTILASFLYFISMVFAFVHFGWLWRVTGKVFPRLETCLPCLVRSNMASRNSFRLISWILLGIQGICLIRAIFLREHQDKQIGDLYLVIPIIDGMLVIVISSTMTRFMRNKWWDIFLIISIIIPMIKIGLDILMSVFFPPVNYLRLILLNLVWLLLWITYTGSELLFQRRKK